MRIYRIEDKSGVGPYRCDGNYELYEALRPTQCSESHPSMWDDTKAPPWNSDYFCGFESIEQLLNWFEPYLDQLHKHNMYLAEYVCTDVYKGKYQVVFNKAKARLVSRERV